MVLKMSLLRSRQSHIDGDKGILRYRGYDVSELAEKSTLQFPYLLIYGALPDVGQLTAFQTQLRKSRAIPEGLVQILKSVPKTTSPMAWLRTGVSALASFDPKSEDNSPEENLRKTIELTAGSSPPSLPRLSASGKNLPVIQPDLVLDHASNYLYMNTGKKPDELSRKAMDMALILQADHELNASTFSARVTTSTLSDMYSAVTSAVGALKGPLHGGANQRVMEMLEKIGTLEKAEPFIREQLAAKKKIMGFGHRVYTTFDPRAAVLKVKSKELSQKIGPAKWFEISEVIEKIMIGEKRGSTRIWISTPPPCSATLRLIPISTRLSSRSAASSAGPRT